MLFAVASGPWVLVQLGAVLLGLLGLAYWLRRRVDARLVGERGRSIRLTGEHAVHVVGVEGRRFVFGTGPGGAPTLLAELSSPSDVEQTDPGRPASESSGQGWTDVA